MNFAATPFRLKLIDFKQDLMGTIIIPLLFQKSLKHTILCKNATPSMLKIFSHFKIGINPGFLCIVILLNIWKY